MAEPSLDLSQLAIDRSPAASTSTAPPRRKWLSRYVLPAVILLGFVALLGSAIGDRLFSAQPVTVVPVLTKRGSVRQEGAVLFQAAGWIEPRPTATRVAALTAGVIEELLVVEGQQVEAGEPIARLISTDAELAVRQAEATLAIREGECQQVEAEQKAARLRLQHPVHLTVPLADARSKLARTTTELEQQPFLISAAEANVAFTRSSLNGKRAAREAIARIAVEQAEKDHATAAAQLQELRVRGPNLKREAQAQQAKVDALQQQLELLIEETRQVEEAQARVVAATALKDEARLKLRAARLNLQRTTVTAPTAGRILSLVSSPGSRVMGLNHNAGQSSSTVVEMYDPQQLQVRADVRLEDVPLVTPGALVQIETASSGGMLQGRVLRPTSSANIQKNTLEVKVELLDPPAAVSPEMLVTATFLAPPTSVPEGSGEDAVRLFVPSQLIQSANDQSTVWIVDADRRAVHRAVTTGATDEDGLTEITSGLTVTDRVISSDLRGLQTNDVVVITGEDTTLGIER